MSAGLCANSGMVKGSSRHLPPQSTRQSRPMTKPVPCHRRRFSDISAQAAGTPAACPDDQQQRPWIRACQIARKSPTTIPPATGTRTDRQPRVRHGWQPPCAPTFAAARRQAGRPARTTTPETPLHRKHPPPRKRVAATTADTARGTGRGSAPAKQPSPLGTKGQRFVPQST